MTTTTAHIPGYTLDTTSGDDPTYVSDSEHAIDPWDHIRVYVRISWTPATGEVYLAEETGSLMPGFDCREAYGTGPTFEAALDAAVDDYRDSHESYWRG